MNHPKFTAQQARNFLSKVPFAVLLGIKLTRLHRDGVTIECAVRHELTNSFAVAHGGVAATLADAAVGLALNRHFGGQRPVTTVELKINYFLPANEGRIFARARLLRIGSTLCVGGVDLTDVRGKRIGTALATYMLLDARATKAVT
jgi:acyl-CoA thioesterase